jgi:oligopeptide/dipeptide ABC transporter ATP-binding protein
LSGVDPLKERLYDADMSIPVMEIRGLHVRYERKGRVVDAVRGVDLRLEAGESLGVIGESGCGKSSLGKGILGLVPSTAASHTLFGQAVDGWSASQWRPLRRRAQIVFQDVGGSLSPRMRIGAAVTEALAIHEGLKGRALNVAAGRLLDEVGLSPELAKRYPHELSGGQRQRVLIARSLSLRPELLIADEPTASLDLSVQMQVLKLLEGLRSSHGFSLVLITHDVRAVRALCGRVLVMYAGRVVEEGPTDVVLATPEHPYTERLTQSLRMQDVPTAEPGLGRDAPSGSATEICGWLSHCPLAVEKCRSVPPPWPAHESRVRCHRPLVDRRSPREPATKPFPG